VSAAVVVAGDVAGHLGGPALTLGALVLRAALPLVLAAGWMLSLALARTYDSHVFGGGPMEYQRVAGASLRWFAIVVAVLFFADLRSYASLVVMAFVAGLTGLLVCRSVWRTWLIANRSRGMTTAVLAVGLRDQAERLIRELNDRPSGYRVVGVCAPAGAVMDEEILGVPVLGDLAAAGAVAARVGAHCVAVCGSGAVTAEVVRKLGWELEPVGVDLMLTTELADVAGPRITVTPAAGVCLMHVDAPRFDGPRYVIKAAMDWIGAAIITLVISPVLLVIALGVKTFDNGPVFFTQQRVGRDGRAFKMIKFRTMVVDADSQALTLAGVRNDGSGPLFKQKNDPRVTAIGRFLRRYSLDELPQLFNVLAGNMSLVGPRPSLQREVNAYEARMMRRMLVKPGLTGLWQVSGRSDLPWEECVRLDVYYAENWTPFGDIAILARTIKAMLGASGAY
jgi:exopolysaccharide biosynthesis polyprenyl glycosylphosphotransferase